MANYGHIIFYSLIGGVFSLIGGVLMLSHKRLAEILAAYATPFAAGALLAAVFMDLLKDGLKEASVDIVLLSTMVGMVSFFFAERFLHWFHHHHQHEAKDPTTSLVIVGDTVHNALDGVVIAAAFLISVPTGIVTTIAVAAHEIPQEIGDFGLLLARGMSRMKVLWVNIVSALATTGMAIITFALGSAGRLPTGALIGVSAGFLLYIAASDIIPEIHEKASNRRLLEWQPILLLIGVVTVTLAISLAHSVTDVALPIDSPESLLCQKHGVEGSIVTGGYPKDMPLCSNYNVEQLPNCSFNGAIFVNTPCFSPDGSTYL